MRIALSLLATAAAVSLASPAEAQGRPTTFRGTLAQCSNGHNIRLHAGRRYTIGATSGDFDTVLHLYRVGQDRVLAEDDDGGEGNNSLLTYTASETAIYRICVTAFGSGGGAGAYLVSVAPAPPLARAVTVPSGTEQLNWQVYDGRLGAGDGGESDVEFLLAPGERAMISAESGDFDTVLRVYAADQRGGEPVAQDDDGGGALSSFLLFAPPEGGRFVVRVAAFSSGATGAYRLRIARSAILRPGAPEQPDGHDEQGEAEH